MKRLVNQRGISLMEVLITALILGVGLLGTAALQVTSLNSNQSGYFRSQATSIAEDVASRMRAAKMSLYDNSTLTIADVLLEYSAAPYSCNAGTSCITGTCSISELADYDQSELCNRAAAELPDGAVYVVNTSGIRAQVAVAWTPVSARSDLGQTTQIVNESCADVQVPNGMDCVILEVIP